MQETWVQSLGQEDPLEKGIATCFSILAWKIPWTEETGRLQSMGSKRDVSEEILDCLAPTEVPRPEEVPANPRDHEN